MSETSLPFSLCPSVLDSGQRMRIADFWEDSDNFFHVLVCRFWILRVRSTSCNKIERVQRLVNVYNLQFGFQGTYEV